MSAVLTSENMSPVTFRSIASFGVFALLLFGFKLWLIQIYGNATPSWDQWDMEAETLYRPYLEGALRWQDFYSLHCEHRLLTTRVLALSLLIINGIWNPLLQMVVNAALHVATLSLYIALLTRVVGRGYLPALLIFALLLFGLPYAIENSLAGIGSQFYFVLLFGVLALWLMVLQSPLSPKWCLGFVCGLLAFLSVASGILVFAVVAGLAVLAWIMGLDRSKRLLMALMLLGVTFAVGVAATPTIAEHAQLKAASVGAFMNSLMAVLSWPFGSHSWAALWRHLPSLFFVISLLRQRPQRSDPRWFLLALVVWTFGQSVLIAYGRSLGNLVPRYLDLYAVNMLVNFVCLLYMLQYLRHGLRWLLCACWLASVFLALGSFVHLQTRQLLARHELTLIQEQNTHNFLVSADQQFLLDKPNLHIPYPRAETLIRRLSLPTIQSILPLNVRKPEVEQALDGLSPGGVMVNGLSHLLAKPLENALGSFNEQGGAAMGDARVHFAGRSAAGMLAIPLAGFPDSEGVEVSLEQSGRRTILKLDLNPVDTWRLAFVAVEAGPYDVHVVDHSPITWVAVGKPRLAGKLDAWVHECLQHFWLFILAGMVLLILLALQNSFLKLGAVTEAYEVNS